MDEHAGFFPDDRIDRGQEIIRGLLLAQVHAALRAGAARQLVGRTVTGYLCFAETGVSRDEC